MSEQGMIFAIGIVAAIVSYFSKNYIFDPLLTFNKVKGRIHHQLKYHARAFGNEINEEMEEEASKAMRLASCDLEEIYFTIACRRYLSRINVLPNADDVNDAARNLIRLSNTTGRVSCDNQERIWDIPNQIRAKLRIPTLER